MTMIDVDFDVFKELTVRRKTEATTYNDVIRELLRLPANSAPKASSGGSGHGWVQKGVTFPNGTEFRATHKGKTYMARVSGSQMMLDGEPMNSFSEAATHITKNSVNGWRFWECKLPNETTWRSVESLKQ